MNQYAWLEFLITKYALLSFLIPYLGSRMPWQPTNASMTLCSKHTELQKNLQIWHNIYNTNEHKFQEETGCIAPCTRQEFKTKMIYQDTEDSREDILHLEMFYANTKHQVREQYYTYDWIDLFSDFGGYMGLLLGASLLTFYDLARGIYSRGCETKSM